MVELLFVPLTWGATAAVGYCVWLAVRSVHTIKGSNDVSHAQGYYDQKRQRLTNHGFLRLSYVAAAIVYIAALTYAQLTAGPEDVHAGQAAGLLLAYCIIMFVLWSVIAFLVPFVQSLLITYNSVVSVCIFTAYSLYCNYAHSMGIMHTTDNLERVLSYNLLWLFEDAPYMTYKWPLASMALLHYVTHLRYDAILRGSPLQALVIGGLYTAFGLGLPHGIQYVLQCTIRPIKLPMALFRTICTLANAVSIIDLVTRIPLVARPLHAAAKSGGWGAGLLAALQSEHFAPGRNHPIGLSPQLMFSSSATLLLTVVVCCGVLTLCEEPHSSSAKQAQTRKSSSSSLSPQQQQHLHAFLYKATTEVPSLKPVLAFLRSLDERRRSVLCLILGTGCMQLVTMVLLASSLVLTSTTPASRSNAPLRFTPIVLLHVLLGLGVQVLGVVYLVTPTPPPTSSPDSMKQRAAALVQAPVSDVLNDASPATAPSQQAPTREDSEGTLLRASTTQSFQAQNSLNGEGFDGVQLSVRLESLANYKAFMQGLDSQPDSYSLDEFIGGSANAIRGVFPKVHHASFCLLSSNRSSVNMYTFLGEGSQKAPRINVAVAPSTLIYHVLNNCQPVFIPNIANFPGPFSDVQFMRFVLGLKSVACLPLVSPAGRVLGVLRLGFQEPREWPEQEKAISKQVALILSSGSSTMGGGGASMGGAAPSGSQGYPTSMPPPLPGLASSRGSLASVDAQLAALQSGGAAWPAQNLGSPGIAPVIMPQVPPGMPPSVMAAVTGMGMANGVLGAPPYDAVNSAGHWPSGSMGAGMPAMPTRPSSVAGSAVGMPVRMPTSQGLLTGTSGSQSGVPDHVQAMYGSSLYQPYGHSVDSQGQSSLMDANILSAMGSGAAAAMMANSQHLDPMTAVRNSIVGPMNSMGSSGMPAYSSQPIYPPQSLSRKGSSLAMGGDSAAEAQLRWDDPPLGMSGGRAVARAGNPSVGGSLMPSKATSSAGTPDTISEAGVRRAGAHEDLKMMEVIGRGGFGSVYKAIWRGRLVAVKVLEHGDDFLGCADNTRGGSGNTHNQARKLDMRSRRAALLEGAMTSTINHPNVVTTYDYRVVHLNPVPSQGLGTTRISQETHIVMEWCDRGSLQDAMEQGVFNIDKSLRATKDVELDMEPLCMTLAEVSSAMDYLHTHRITHRDLKPKNVLLKSSQKDRRGFCAKVSDFGLSQVLPDSLDRTQVSKNYSGTVTHMPPELIEDGKVYPQGDIYAFGIMMWEVYTGATPYAHMAHPQIMVAVVTHNLRPRFPEGTPDWYKSLAYKCWHKDHKARPSFSEITAQLMEHVGDTGWQAVVPADTDAAPIKNPASPS